MNDPQEIRAWQRLDARTTTSGRLEQVDIARLAAIGTRHVIKLALDDHPEALAGEGDLLGEAHIAYTHIPVPFDAPTEEHYADFKRALDASDGPVHVHCIMNWRVSAFFYRLNRERGMAKEAALALMHEQWAPELSNDPRVVAWADFIGKAGT